MWKQDAQKGLRMPKKYTGIETHTNMTSKSVLLTTVSTVRFKFLMINIYSSLDLQKFWSYIKLGNKKCIPVINKHCKPNNVDTENNCRETCFLNNHCRRSITFFQNHLILISLCMQLVKCYAHTRHCIKLLIKFKVLLSTARYKNYTIIMTS